MPYLVPSSRSSSTRMTAFHVAHSPAFPENNTAPPGRNESEKRPGRRGQWMLAMLAAAMLLITLLLPTKAELDGDLIFIGGENDFIDGLAWGDMDADGDLDVAVSNWDFTDEYIAYVYENTGTSFRVHSKLYAAPNEDFGHPAWGDFDGDGDLDVAFGHAIYANNGSNFTSVFEAPAAYWQYIPVWVDFDGDGDLDFSLGGALYQNNNGTFSDIPVIDYPGETSAWGDMDRDGDQDMALAIRNEPPDEPPIIQVYRNFGSQLQLGGKLTNVSRGATH